MYFLLLVTLRCFSMHQPFKQVTKLACDKFKQTGQFSIKDIQSTQQNQKIPPPYNHTLGYILVESRHGHYFVQEQSHILN